MNDTNTQAATDDELTVADTYVSTETGDGLIIKHACAATDLRAIAEGRADLLDELRQLRYLRDAIDTEMRILVALGRYVTHPRPYTLRSLADAAGASVSGIRTYTHARHVEYVRDVLGTDAVTTWKDTEPS